MNSFYLIPHRNAWKVFAILKASLLIILVTGCAPVEINYIPTSNADLWIGNYNRNVEVVGEVLAVHYAPSIYSREATFTVIAHDDGQVMLFCLENSYPTGTLVTVRGAQTSPKKVYVPSPTGFTEEYYIAICVDEIEEVANNYEI